MMMMITQTRLSSNLRPTTRECVQKTVRLVTPGHFRSRDLDGGHTSDTIRSAPGLEKIMI